jgi:hypothetical protein
MDNNFIDIRNIVKDVLINYGLDSDTYSLLVISEKEFGKLVKNIQIIGKKGQNLLVKVNNSIYKQELLARKTEIINKINGHFGKKIINDIKVVRE